MITKIFKMLFKTIKHVVLFLKNNPCTTIALTCFYAIYIPKTIMTKDPKQKKKLRIYGPILSGIASATGLMLDKANRINKETEEMVNKQINNTYPKAVLQNLITPEMLKNAKHVSLADLEE